MNNHCGTCGSWNPKTGECFVHGKLFEADDYCNSFTHIDTVEECFICGNPPKECHCYDEEEVKI